MTDNKISWTELFTEFGKIGLFSFGGPAAQIGMLQHLLVDKKRWIDQERFLHALNFCMLLPGPEAMQLATYAGWTMKGWRGGLLAGLLFVLPGAAIMLALSAIYIYFGHVDVVAGLLFGLKAAADVQTNFKNETDAYCFYFSICIDSVFAGSISNYCYRLCSSGRYYL